MEVIVTSLATKGPDSLDRSASHTAYFIKVLICLFLASNSAISKDKKQRMISDLQELPII